MGLRANSNDMVAFRLIGSVTSIKYAYLTDGYALHELRIRASVLQLSVPERPTQGTYYLFAKAFPTSLHLCVLRVWISRNRGQVQLVAFAVEHSVTGFAQDIAMVIGEAAELFLWDG
ncbi:hypothetical protein BASA62_003442 [Batrachochytrium salamandrivorans]|nr:hypothetical protein BASA62_003442 [Batrachochytrium salamandrivorans]